MINKIVSTSESIVSLYKDKINELNNVDKEIFFDELYSFKCGICNFDFFLEETLKELDNICVQYNQVLSDLDGVKKNLYDFYDNFIGSEVMLEKFFSEYCEVVGSVVRIFDNSLDNEFQEVNYKK